MGLSLTNFIAYCSSLRPATCYKGWLTKTFCAQITLYRTSLSKLGIFYFVFFCLPFINFIVIMNSIDEKTAAKGRYFFN